MKVWPQCHKAGSWQGCQSCFCQKEQSHLSRSPDCEAGESQGEREPHLDKRGGSERERGEERVDSTVHKGRFQEG